MKISRQTEIVLKVFQAWFLQQDELFNKKLSSTSKPYEDLYDPKYWKLFNYLKDIALCGREDIINDFIEKSKMKISEN